MHYDEISVKKVQVKWDRECGWCGETIKAGDTAAYRVYKLDKQFTSDYMHPECFDACCELDEPMAWTAGDWTRGEITPKEQRDE